MSNIKMCEKCGKDVSWAIYGHDCISTTKSWEESFEERWNHVMRGTGVGYGNQQIWLKDFITSLLQQQKEEIVKVVGAHQKQNTYEDDEALVYKTTIKEVLDLINTIKN